MTMTLELTPELQAGLLAQARASGLSLEAYAKRVLQEAAAPPLSRSQLAGQRIRELRQGVTLGDLSIKELIEEGRE